jgi:hypothetical protein
MPRDEGRRPQGRSAAKSGPGAPLPKSCVPPVAAGDRVARRTTVKMTACARSIAKRLKDSQNTAMLDHP